MKSSAKTNNDNDDDSKMPAKKAARAQSPPKRANKLFIREGVTITPEGTRTVGHDCNWIKSILKDVEYIYLPQKLFSKQANNLCQTGVRMPKQPSKTTHQIHYFTDYND